MEIKNTTQSADEYTVIPSKSGKTFQVIRLSDNRLWGSYKKEAQATAQARIANGTYFTKEEN